MFAIREQAGITVHKRIKLDFESGCRRFESYRARHKNIDMTRFIKLGKSRHFNLMLICKHFANLYSTKAFFVFAFASLIISSKLAAAASCNPGKTCEYVSSVILMLECPRRSLTILGCTPCLSNRVA